MPSSPEFEFQKSFLGLIAFILPHVPENVKRFRGIQRHLIETWTDKTGLAGDVRCRSHPARFCVLFIKPWYSSNTVKPSPMKALLVRPVSVSAQGL